MLSGVCSPPPEEGAVQSGMGGSPENKTKKKQNKNTKSKQYNGIPLFLCVFLLFMVLFSFVFSIFLNIIIKNVCDVSYFHLVLLFGFLLIIIIISFKYPILGYSHNYIKESKQRKA